MGYGSGDYQGLPPVQAGGKLLQEGMEENHSLLTFDLRLTDISQESEYSINQVVKGNQDRAKHSHAVST